MNKQTKHDEFEKLHGIKIDNTTNFKTIELADQYAKLYCQWWGSNLVYLGSEEINGYFRPAFNVFD